jgi:Protein of unknown function (DUF3618)
MGEDPEAIERQIEETRGRIGARVDALTEKANVGSRVTGSVAERRDAITGGIRQAISGASEATPSGDDVRYRAQRSAGTLRDKPLALALGAAAAGALVGLLIPSTAVEDEKLGATADTLKAKARETGEEALARGQQVVEDVSETARRSGQSQAEQLRDSARERVDDVKDSSVRS